jgi:hypothetical protein
MNLHRLVLRSILLLVLVPTVPAWADGQQIPTPEEFFGHVMGADRELARWDKLVDYYDMIGERSNRVQVVHMGPTTLGNPFLSIFVSSPENLANLEEIKVMNEILQDPRGHSPDEIENAIENGKVVFVQSYGLHSTEVAASQSAAEIMYDFATRTDDEITEILENTVSILIPAFNPDGNVIVTDWYNRWVGTEYEGANPPNSTITISGTITIAMRSCRTRSSLGMGLRSSSANGSLRATSITTRWDPIQPESIYLLMLSPSARVAIRLYGARCLGTGHIWPTKWRRKIYQGP